MVSRRVIPAALAIVAVSAGSLFADNATVGGRRVPAANASQPAPVFTLDQVVRTAAGKELDALEAGGDFAQALARLDALFDQVIAVGSQRAPEAFSDAAFARRLVAQLQELPADQRVDTLKYLRAHDTLARTLAFLIEPQDKAPARRITRGSPAARTSPYAVLNDLRQKHADDLDKYANLTAAICVVHDRKLQRQINENATAAPDPVDIFEYYTGHEKNMLFGLKNVPAELLVYVVDTTASIDDMTWALKKYAGDQAVARHFFDVPYDYQKMRTGNSPQLSENGYTLPNILKYGGVCADQAYFATEAGKSIGVPTAYASAASGESSHAWVGFLQAAGDKGFWNFNVGRYSEYVGIRGDVMDPQTRQRIPDSYVSLLGELIGRTPAQRQAAVALADAAARLAGSAAFAPQPLAQKITDALQTPRAAGGGGADAALELLEWSIEQNRGYRGSWLIVRDLAQGGKLALPQKIKWSNAVLKLCGARYPDFAMALLEPMIDTVDDPAQQIQLWDAAFAQFQARADLGADIRMHQAALWEKQGATAKAGRCYEEVIDRYANAGPFVLAALSGAARLLEGQPDKVLQLYEQTWAKTLRPMDSANMRESNWYKVGTMYAAKLKEAGQNTKADTVAAQLAGTATANPK